MIPYIKIVRKKTFLELVDQVEKIGRLRKQELDFIRHYRTSNYESLPSINNTVSSEVIEGIITIHKTVAQLIHDINDKRWLDASMTKFNDFLARRDSVADGHFYQDLVSGLVKHLNANQGAIYLIDDPTQTNYKIEEVAKYAYNRHKKNAGLLLKGEGLVGQCILDKDHILITDIPQYYTKITSGLGEATPNCLLIMPLMLEELPIGVIELASFNIFSEKEIKFLETISKLIATTINNIQQSQQLISLYRQSQDSQKEIREQEEKIRQQMEELMASNENMSRKTKELEESKKLLEESNREMQQMKEAERYIIESKLEAQRTSYELIINRLKNRLQLQN